MSLAEWWRRHSTAVRRQDVEGIQLAGPAWELPGRVDQAEFFRALADLVPQESILLLEDGSPPDDMRKWLETMAVPARAKLAPGTSGPSVSFHLPATDAVLHRLATFADHCAAPEICIHLHVYDAQGVLVQWYDAFDDPLYLSGRLEAGKVDAFCQALAVTRKSSALSEE